MTRSAEAPQSLFSMRTAILAILISVISFSSLIVLMAFAPDLEDKNSAGHHAYSKSALGYNMAVELLELTGHDVQISRNPDLLNDHWGENLLVLTPSDSHDARELAETDFNRMGPILVILPKRWGEVSFTNSRHQAFTGLIEPGNIELLLDEIGEGIKVERVPAVSEVNFDSRTAKASFKDKTQVLKGELIDPIMTVEGGILFGRLYGTDIYVLADPELANTHGLTSLDNARLMIDVFDYAARDGVFEPITFDTTLHGFERSRNLMRLLFEPPLLGATLFTVATALLLGWTAFIRFGRLPPPKPVFATGRATLIESTAGLFSQTDREYWFAGDYGDLVRRLAVSDLGYPDDLTAAQIEQIIARNQERQNAAGKQGNPQPKAETVKTPGQLISFAQAYHQWKKDLSDERE